MRGGACVHGGACVRGGACVHGGAFTVHNDFYVCIIALQNHSNIFPHHVVIVT